MKRLHIVFFGMFFIGCPAAQDAGNDAGGAENQDAGIWTDLTCDERVVQSNEWFQGFVEARLSCSADSDCAAVDLSNQCEGQCPVAIQADRVDDAREAVEMLNDSLCADYVEDGCMLSLAACVEEFPRCIEGACAMVEEAPPTDGGTPSDAGVADAGDPNAGNTDGGITDAGEEDAGEDDDGGAVATDGGAGQTCEARTSEAIDTIDSLIAGLQTCSVDEDCALVSRETDCLGRCQGVVNADAVQTIQNAVTELNNGTCANFTDDGCPYATPGCAPVAPSCDNGTCVLVDVEP